MHSPTYTSYFNLNYSFNKLHKEIWSRSVKKKPEKSFTTTFAIRKVVVVLVVVLDTDVMRSG